MKTLKTVTIAFMILCTSCQKEKTVAVNGVTFNQATLTIVAGNSETLVAIVYPEDATNKSVTWSSSNTSVATVEASGKVMAVAAGTATITVTTVDGGKKASCNVTVISNNVTAVTLNKTALTLNVKESETLIATIQPPHAANKAVTWSSSHATIATVDAGGKVTAVAEGTATITVTTVDGGKTATCQITVNPPVPPPFSGEGSKENPFLINTREELEKLAILVNTGKAPYANKNIYYRLENDLNFAGWGKTWEPIGKVKNMPFQGIFDGASHTVSNLNIPVAIECYSGLFGHVTEGTINNLGVKDIVYQGFATSDPFTTGGITGYLLKGNISNCFVVSDIRGGASTGGIVGYATESNIANCYFYGDVLGAIGVGGIVGSMESSTVELCHAGGNVTGNIYAGGIAGYLLNARNYVINCYATNYLFGTQNTGGIAGGAYGYGATPPEIQNCVALNENIRNSSPTGYGRVIGMALSVTNCYARSSMLINSSVINTGTSTNKDGANVAESATLTAAFWVNTVGWDAAKWSFENGRLPILRSVGGDQLSKNPPAHLK